MRRSEFLDELYYGLQGRMSAEDIGEIVADYEEIFDSGMTEGKSEEELTAELGSPAKLVRDLLQEEAAEGRPGSESWSCAEDQQIKQGQAEGVFRRAAAAADRACESPFPPERTAGIPARLGAWFLDGLLPFLLMIVLVLTAVGGLFFGPGQGLYRDETMERSWLGEESAERSNVEYTRYPKGQAKSLWSMEQVVGQDGNLLSATVYRENETMFEGSGEELELFFSDQDITSEQMRVIHTMKTYAESESSLGDSMAKGWRYLRSGLLRSWNSVSMRTPFLLFLPILFSAGCFASLYQVLTLWLTDGYTLGKYLFHMRVVRKDGKRVGFLTALLREFAVKGLLNSCLGGIPNLISLLWACVTPEHQTIHDLVCRTAVLTVEKKSGGQ